MSFKLSFDALVAEILERPLPERAAILEIIVESIEVEQPQEEPPYQERSILELEGLGAELWEGIDAQKYVDELREEWRERP
ncbi:MAG TPA: hypothetical protein VF707_14300 [Ardenticatenaceae bacterium]